MFGHLSPPRRGVREETIEELRRNLGLFSFRDEPPTVKATVRGSLLPDLGIRPGGVVSPER